MFQDRRDEPPAGDERVPSPRPQAPDEPPGHEPVPRSPVAAMPFWTQVRIGTALGVPLGFLLGLVVIAVMKLLHRS
jgi:hypothetical protein